MRVGPEVEREKRGEGEVKRGEGEDDERVRGKRNRWRGKQ